MQSNLRFVALSCALCMLCVSPYLLWDSKTRAANQPPSPVLLTALVTGPDKEPVTTFTQADFQVLENNQPQPITVFQRALPVSYGIVVDNTGSMQEVMSQVLQIARALAKGHQPEDQAFLARMFDGKVLLPVPWTADKTLLLNSLNSLNSAKGGTTLLDTLLASLDYAIKRPNNAAPALPHYSLFVISDGVERDMTPDKLRDLKKRLHTETVQVFPICIQDRDRNADTLFGKTTHQQARELLSQLASESGGRLFHLEDKANPTQVGELAARYLRSQYVIGYTPSSAATKDKRKVQVKLVPKPNGPKLTLSSWLPE